MRVCVGVVLLLLVLNGVAGARPLYPRAACEMPCQDRIAVCVEQARPFRRRERIERRCARRAFRACGQRGPAACVLGPDDCPDYVPAGIVGTWVGDETGCYDSCVSWHTKSCTPWWVVDGPTPPPLRLAITSEACGRLKGSVPFGAGGRLSGVVPDVSFELTASSSSVAPDPSSVLQGRFDGGALRKVTLTTRSSNGCTKVRSFGVLLR